MHGDRTLVQQLCQVLLRPGGIVLANCKGKGMMVISDLIIDRNGI